MAIIVDVLDTCITDPEHYDSVITEVSEGETHWGITCKDSWAFSIDKRYGVVPLPGDRVRIYGLIGLPIRGVSLNGKVVYYRTHDDQEIINKKNASDWREANRRKYEANKREYESRILELPPQFQLRFARFWKNNPEFWEFIGYELFCCQEAIKISNHYKTSKEIRDFYNLPVDKQHEAVPELDYNNHSGNTFGAACVLAEVYMSTTQLVDRVHGALCPLVGCKNYGCFTSEGVAHDE